MVYAEAVLANVAQSSFLTLISSGANYVPTRCLYSFLLALVLNQ